MQLGYSDKSLCQKLGIKQGYIISLINPPEDYGHLLFPIPPDCRVLDHLTEQSDLIHYFCTEKGSLRSDFAKLKSKLKPDGSLWISWPKIGSKVKTDVNENVIREIALDNGLVDVKVLAINELWSGLKLVYRLKDRGND